MDCFLVDSFICCQLTFIRFTKTNIFFNSKVQRIQKFPMLTSGSVSKRKCSGKSQSSVSCGISQHKMSVKVFLPLTFFFSFFIPNALLVLTSPLSVLYSKLHLLGIILLKESNILWEFWGKNREIFLSVYEIDYFPHLQTKPTQIIEWMEVKE